MRKSRAWREVVSLLGAGLLVAVADGPLPGQDVVGARPPALTQDKRDPMPPPPPRFWKLEIAYRDDPLPVDAEFDLNIYRPVGTFMAAQGQVETEHGRWSHGAFLFHLPENPLCGAADGELRFTKDRLDGVLTTARGRQTLHGRLKRPAAGRIGTTPSPVTQGPGFRDLILEVKGVGWSLADRMRFHHVPAVSLARIEDYRVVEEGAFGVTDVETGEPATPDTLFQAGSMGSPLVGLLALRLAAEGRLDLNRPVNTYLKSGQITDNTFTQNRKTTVLDLMQGASGLSQYKFRGYPPDQKAPALSALLAGADPFEMEPLTPVRTPGTIGREGVCGALLEAVIVDVTGISFPRLMQTEIFAACGMAHSTYAPSPTTTARGRVALGHYGDGTLTLDRFHRYPEQGESGLWTTAGDFARLLCQVQLLLAGKPNHLLPPDKQMLAQSLRTEHGFLGFIAAKKDDFLPIGYLYHGGASYGYYANHATHSTNGSGVVVMENRNLSWALNNEIIQAVCKRSPAQGSL